MYTNKTEKLISTNIYDSIISASLLLIHYIQAS